MSLLNEYDVLARETREKIKAVMKLEKPEREMVFDALDALYEQKYKLEEILWEIEGSCVYEWVLLSGLGARWGFREEDLWARYQEGPPARWVVSLPYVPEPVQYFRLGTGESLRVRESLKDLFEYFIERVIPKDANTLFHEAFVCFEFRFPSKRRRDADNCGYIVTPVLNALQRTRVLYDDCNVRTVLAAYPSDEACTMILVMEARKGPDCFLDLAQCVLEEGFRLARHAPEGRFRGYKSHDNENYIGV